MNSLKERLSQKRLVVAPGVYDALSALLVERAGFEAAYVSGASVAYTRFGRPDIGFLSLDDVADVVGHITQRVSTPLVVDADTGFGNALNVVRTVKILERAGASAIQLEDQTLPKRCGHLDGKTLVSKTEMIGKIKAAVDARRSADTLIVARTDAVAVEGLSAALDRAHSYAEAGADILFVEALRTENDMNTAFSTLGLGTPMLANMVEGGKTPVLPATRLQEIGYSIAIYPGGTVRALAHNLSSYLRSLQVTGSTTAFLDRMESFDSLNELIGTPEMLALGKRYSE